MKLGVGSLLHIPAVFLFSLYALAQLTIDATGGHREPRSGKRIYGGILGRRLPVQVAVEVHGVPSGEEGKTVVEFVLTNSSKEGLRIPISPDPDQVEGPEAAYSYKLLRLYITSDPKREKALPGGARLYGNEESATMVTLAPGDSVRVRAEVALGSVSGTGEKRTVALVAHAMLVDQKMTTVDGERVVKSLVTGAAKSPEYTLEASGSLRLNSAPEEKK
jgi:hypothetical protein